MTRDGVEGWAMFYLPLGGLDPTPFYLAPIRGGITNVTWYVSNGDHRWAMKTVNRLKIEPKWCFFWDQRSVAKYGGR